MLYLTHNDPATANWIIKDHINTKYNYFKEWKIKINESNSEFSKILGRCVDTPVALRRQAKTMNIRVNK